jgi:hypothetical protein
MKEKLLMLIGLGQIMFNDNYVDRSFRRELKRKGRRLLRDMSAKEQSRS